MNYALNISARLLYHKATSSEADLARGGTVLDKVS